MKKDNALEQYSHLGHKLWNRYYRGRKTDRAAFIDYVSDSLLSGTLDHRHDATDILCNLTLGRWVDGACRTIRPVSKEFFSALCWSSISAEAYDDLRLPWPAFAIEIPEGILMNPDGESYRLAVVGRLDGLGFWKPSPDSSKMALVPSSEASFGFQSNPGTLSLYTNTDDLILSKFSTTGLDHILFKELPSHFDPHIDLHLSLSDHDLRVMTCAANAVVGMLYTLQHSTNWKHLSKPSRLKSDPRFGPPDHRIMVAGTAIKTDVTDAVRDYVTHGRSTPAFQTLVRGHYQRVVVGKGRTGRKIKWYEPHWRGPISAPILVRPYEVGR